MYGVCSSRRSNAKRMNGQELGTYACVEPWGMCWWTYVLMPCIDGTP
jgi:hypothetical protein